MRDYSPKDFNIANVVKFTIESEKWHPVDPACLGFMACIKECSHPNHTRVGGVSLTADREQWESFKVPGEEWLGHLVGPFDSFKFTTKNVMVTGIALLDPSMDVEEIGHLEGITFEDTPKETLK